MDKPTKYSHFYSTHARYVVSGFSEFRNLIFDYLSRSTKKKLPKQFANVLSLLSERQILEALQQSTTFSFLRTLMSLIANDTELRKHLVELEGRLLDDLEIIKKAMFATAQAQKLSAQQAQEDEDEYEDEDEVAPSQEVAVASIPMDELEALYKEIYVDLQTLQGLLAQLEGAQINSWETRLNEIIKKHRLKWMQLMEIIAKDLGEDMKKNLKIAPSEMELSELTTPTRTRAEIIKELGTLNLGKFAPKNPKKIGTFPLKVIWILGAASGRSMIALDVKAANRVLKNISKLEESERKTLIGQNQQDYNLLVAELNKAKQDIRDVKGLALENRLRLIKKMPKEMVKELRETVKLEIDLPEYTV